ncbi:MAG: tRNA (adenosine(37)-N6)-threonylcarbamoyltransferase complex dimerization subunit type 1 TsaB [Pseudomonadota bacterium]
MVLLAIDTCLSACSAGLLLPGGETRAISLNIGTGHAEHLAPMVSTLLQDHHLRSEAVTKLAVTVGPGSFMGVRVGLSFGKGFAFARKLPTVGVTSLQALWLSAPPGATGYALIDARRGQIYGQAFGKGADHGPFLLGEDEVREKVGDLEGQTLIGSGVSLLNKERESDGPLVPDMALMAQFAKDHAPTDLRPLYLRPPDATPASPPKAIS